MEKIKSKFSLLLILLFFGCAHQGPSNITNDIQYEHDVNLCLNTESYRQCMDKLGYKYQTGVDMKNKKDQTIDKLTSALKQIDELEENSPGTISFKDMFYEAQAIARKTLADLNRKEN